MTSPLDIVHHVAINVSDIKRSVQWYQTSFNCNLVFEDARRALLEFANVKVLLVLPSQEQAHIAYVRQDAAHYGELRPLFCGLQETVIADNTGNMVRLVCPQES